MPSIRSVIFSISTDDWVMSVIAWVACATTSLPSLILRLALLTCDWTVTTLVAVSPTMSLTWRSEAAVSSMVAACRSLRLARSFEASRISVDPIDTAFAVLSTSVMV